MPPDAITSFQQGNYNASLPWRAASAATPTSRCALPSAPKCASGGHQVNFSRWHNDEYDAIVDEMAITPPEDQEALMDQWRRAMEIWLPELPDIPIQEWYHRIPMNTTYWQGWPTRTIPTSMAPSGT